MRRTCSVRTPWRSCPVPCRYAQPRGCASTSSPAKWWPVRLSSWSGGRRSASTRVRPPRGWTWCSRPTTTYPTRAARCCCAPTPRRWPAPPPAGSCRSAWTSSGRPLSSSTCDRCSPGSTGCPPSRRPTCSSTRNCGRRRSTRCWPPPTEPAPPDWSHFRDCVVPAAPAPPAPAVPPDPPDPPEAQYPVLDDPAGYDPAGLLEVHTALVQLCAARSDMFAVLGVPRHFDTAAVLTWLQQLTTAARPSQAGRVVMSPLSFAGFWHPWVRVVEPSTPGRAPLRGPVALARTVSAGDAVRLFDAHANLLQTQPGTISSLSAHTLAAEPTLQQVSVRRLLIVLRKVALLEGGRYVFDTNTERFRQLVRLRFERLLSALTRQGALAAYQVVTGEGTNTAADIDNGRLIVTLRVAPTSPIEFITVNLVRAGEGLLDVVLG